MAELVNQKVSYDCIIPSSLPTSCPVINSTNLIKFFEKMNINNAKLGHQITSVSKNLNEEVSALL